ncbi:hypothetical protein GCM10011487_69540 [Steroidobacter agaridevorans]|uniref:Uncharacterized protein n=1 Tax=Steroidobacter agaridevorans TaxID=2695856 RepID=A0A829YNB2_9GAMM|nr:hypothetical protein GCM10011487_69540 [Steroidobacter agaridevorans]GFE91725.1 hypothetical protein GCM10011488_66790 [Steroidobacter agaridevorans]
MHLLELLHLLIRQQLDQLLLHDWIEPDQAPHTGVLRHQRSSLLGAKFRSLFWITETFLQPPRKLIRFVADNEESALRLRPLLVQRGLASRGARVYRSKHIRVLNDG